jgi:hypothetical protein
MRHRDRFIEKQCNLPHMRRIPSPLVLLVIVCACAMLAGCTGGGFGNRTPVVATTPAGEPEQGVAITSPASGAVLPPGDITVTVRVTGFRMVPEYGQPWAEREGHLHYYMSVGVPEAGGSSSFVAPITYAATTETNYTWPDIPPGTYTFTVELANNDHSPFPRPLTSSVTVRVTA